MNPVLAIAIRLPVYLHFPKTPVEDAAVGRHASPAGTRRRVLNYVGTGIDSAVLIVGGMNPLIMSANVKLFPPSVDSAFILYGEERPIVPIDVKTYAVCPETFAFCQGAQGSMFHRLH